MAHTHRVFMTGGTGYIGKRLIPALHTQGHDVVALVREQSRSKLPWSCTPVIGDALDGDSYRRFAAGADTFIQLVGVSHPSPAKADQFRQIDLKAGLEAVRIAREVNVQHFIYLSVAQPAPVMQAYVDVRAQCEQAISASGLAATILRPWYVLGPGHLWPYFLLPFYKVAELIPQTRHGALRLGLVSIRQMVQALTQAVAEPCGSTRIWTVSDIRTFGDGKVSTQKVLGK
ncbi:MAG TPA: NAD(P)H-binding protein [Bryobacteraceae bacterium]|nr:NAD(P)H-binding protein [Bryobacteraceae bacterium]